MVPAGLFDGRTFQVANQAFFDERPAYYRLANETPELTGEHVFAQFMAGRHEGG